MRDRRRLRSRPHPHKISAGGQECGHRGQGHDPFQPPRSGGRVQRDESRFDCLSFGDGARIAIPNGDLVYGRWYGYRHGPDEPVPFSGDCLDKGWIFRVVFENLTNFADCGIDAVIGVQEDILTPDPFDDVLSGYQLPFALDQQEQDLHGDSLQLQESDQNGAVHRRRGLIQDRRRTSPHPPACRHPTRRGHHSIPALSLRGQGLCFQRLPRSAKNKLIVMYPLLPITPGRGNLPLV